MTDLNENEFHRDLLAAADEEVAWRMLRERYEQSLYEQATRGLGSNIEAQEAVREVLINAWTNLQNTEVAESLSGYLSTALKYCMIKYVARMSRKGMHTPFSIEDLQAGLSPEELIRYRELQELIAHGVEALSMRMRAIYEMSQVQRLPTKEIAKKLGIADQTVRNHLHVTLKRLHKHSMGHTPLASILF